MSKKVKITVEGWRPWKESGKCAITVDIDRALAKMSVEAAYDTKDTGTYMMVLRSALKAIYEHEDKKAQEFLKCPACGRMPMPERICNPLTFFGKPEVESICAADIEEGVPYQED